MTEQTAPVKFPWLPGWQPALSALLLALAFPPFGERGFWALATVALVPLMLALWREPAPRGWRRGLAGLWQGFQFGAVFFIGTLWWIGHVSVGGMLALCLYLALYPAVWGLFVATIGPPGNGKHPVTGTLRQLSIIIVNAAAWCGLEWLRGTLMTGFPWNGAAVPLAPGLTAWTALPAFAGVSGMSVLPLLVSGMVALLILAARGRARCSRPALFVCVAGPVAAAALLCSVFYRTEAPPAESSVTVVLVQQNVPMAVKMSPEETVQVDRYKEIIGMTTAALQEMAPQRPELVIWPESAIPGWFHDEAHNGVFELIMSHGGFSFVLGTDTRMPGFHNNLAVMRGDINNFRLHPKVHLVPFGEFIPLRKELPWMADMLRKLIPNDFQPGTSKEPVRPDGQSYEIMPAVCFEDTIGDLMREFARDGEKQIIVNITNDNWFVTSPAAEMHFANALWRTMELRRPMLRCANTGVTAAVDHTGRVLARLPAHTKGVLRCELPLPVKSDRGLTFYAVHGDVFSKTCLAAAGACFAGVLVLRGIRGLRKR